MGFQTREVSGLPSLSVIGAAIRQSRFDEIVQLRRFAQEFGVEVTQADEDWRVRQVPGVRRRLANHRHRADECNALPHACQVGRVNHVRSRANGRMQGDRDFREAGHRGNDQWLGRGARKAFVEVASPARPRDLAARQPDEPFYRWGNALIGRRRIFLTPNRSIERAAIAVDDVGFIHLEEAEQAGADVLVDPGRVGIGGARLGKALLAHADGFLRQRQLIQAPGRRAPDFRLLRHHRQRIGAACGHEDRTAAQDGGSQKNQRARNEHARTEAPLETV